jgi:uncharacterized phage protein gp47/JayE
MAINIPDNIQEVSNQVRADVQSQLPEVNPYLDSTLLVAMINGFVGRAYDNYDQLRIIIPNLFPDTADDDFALMWGAIFGITPNPATPSLGPVSFTGIAGSQVPINSILNDKQGNQYNLTENVDIVQQSINVISLSAVGNTVTAITSDNHNLASGNIVTISGAVPSAYNVTTPVTVTGLNSFIYTLTTSPTTPATGTILATYTNGTGDVQSLDTGADTNLAGGSQLSFSTPVAGVDNTAVVEFEGLSGGTDTESLNDFRARYLERIRNPNTPFNVATIIATAKEVPGVTRVFVAETTPSLGQVTVRFTRDNDPSIIPTPTEVQTVKNQILTIKPANMQDQDVIVEAPIPRVVNFIFQSLTPDTSTMRDAVNNSLDEFFKESTTLGVDVQQLAYNSAIFNTIDPQTGDKVTAFFLNDPTGDISINSNEIAVLGSITYL